MTEAEAVYALWDAFGSAKVLEHKASTKAAVMTLAIRRQNASRGVERRIGEGTADPLACRMSALMSKHGPTANGTPALNEAPQAQDGTQGFQWPEAI